MSTVRFVFLLTAFIMAAGCVPKPTPNPLVGWQRDYNTRPDDPIIEKDCNDFMQTFQPVGQRPAQVTGIFKDGAGQHAANIEIFEYHKNASWQYFLIYDKDDKRIKVIKYGYCRYQS